MDEGMLSRAGASRSPAGRAAARGESRRIVAMRALMLALWGLGIVQIFVDSAPLAWLMVAGLGVFVVMAVPGSALFNRAIAAVAALVIVVIGTLGGDWQPVREGLLFSLVFVAFLPTLQLVRRTLEASPEVAASRAVFAAMPERERRTGVMTGSHLLGSVLTLGVFAVMAPLAPPGADEAARRRLALATVRGMGLAILWSPFSLGMAFALTVRPELPLWQAMAAGLVLAASGMAVAVPMFDRGGGVRGLARALAGFRPLALPLLGAMAVVVALASATAFSNIQAVVLGMPVLCLLWLLGRERRAIAPTLRATYGGLNRLGDEFMLFVAAVTLGKVLAALPAFVGLFTAPAFLALPTPAILAAFMALAFVLPFLGLHPLVSAGLLFAILSALGDRLADIVAVQIFLFGWATGTTLSIASMQMTVASSLFGVPLGRLLFRENARFMAAFAVPALLLLAGANWLLAG